MRLSNLFNNNFCLFFVVLLLQVRDKAMIKRLTVHIHCVHVLPFVPDNNPNAS